MVTEIEKQFFDTFGIPKIYKTIINIGDFDVNLKEVQAPTLKELYEIAKLDFTTPIYFSWFKRSKKWSEDYPQITDRILLELICIWNLYCTYTLVPTNYKNIKEYVLEQFLLIDTYNFIVDFPIVKHQVRTLFKEG